MGKLRTMSALSQVGFRGHWSSVLRNGVSLVSLVFVAMFIPGEKNGNTVVKIHVSEPQ